VPVQPDAGSPILLLADSHGLVFHLGEDMHARGAGLADQLAMEFSIPVECLAVRGSGATPARISLYRKQRRIDGYLASKKALIWCFAAREFTESSGWRKVPVTRDLPKERSSRETIHDSFGAAGPAAGGAGSAGLTGSPPCRNKDRTQGRLRERDAMSRCTTMAVACALLAAGCSRIPDSAAMRSFGEDLRFLREHTDAVLLSGAAGRAQVVVVPQYQGRVMTSTSAGAEGMSYGWINHKLIASGKMVPHMNVFGGEDRLWLAPEGGQFSIFFRKGEPFDLEHWQTPPVVDTEPYDVVDKQADSVSFRKRTQLVNYSGTKFDLQIDRTVRVLAPGGIAKALAIPLPEGVRAVGFESETKMTNTGASPWEKKTGLLAIWILGQYNPTPGTTIVIPFRAGDEAKLGPALNRYPSFGQLAPERLKIKGNVVYFRGDGRRRNKIGIYGRRAMGVCGSFDATNDLLTIVQFNQPAGAKDYVNSTWAIQKTPYVGDAISSYNDGPLKPGEKALGGFYELETLSPAAALKPGGSIVHVHRTLHFQGPREGLDRIAKAALKRSLDDITGALPKVP